MATNITNAPKTVNGVPNSIYNNADFGTSDDIKYIKRAGDVMSGSLTVPSLVCNGTIGLPTAYTTAPTISQLGGASTRLTWSDVATVASTNTNIRSFTVEQGSYLIFYRVALNNLTASTINLNSIQTSISTANNVLDEDYKTSNMASQSIPVGSNTSLNNCIYYNNASGTQKTLFLNYISGVAGLTIRGFIQVIRIG